MRASESTESRPPGYGLFVGSPKDTSYLVVSGAVVRWSVTQNMWSAEAEEAAASWWAEVLGTQEL